MGVSAPMPTYLVAPPAFRLRMEFMDALEDAGIDYSREPEGYFIYLREGQQPAWEQVRKRFDAEVVEEDPLSLFGA